MEYIKITVVALIPVPPENLSYYEAEDIKQAVSNQREWFKKEMVGLDDLLDTDRITVTFTAVRDDT